MQMVDQLRNFGVGFNQAIAEFNRIRRRKTNTVDTVDRSDMV
jgi:hypothetical protein